MVIVWTSRQIIIQVIETNIRVYLASGGDLEITRHGKIR